MADVKWIKLATGLPDNRKIKQIRRLPEGDTIALMWIFLMCLAGETNDDGMVYFTPEIPFTEEMLADQFSIDINTIRLGLTTFQRFGMIEIVDDIICLPSWEKWQSVDKLSEIREQTRKRVAKHREKQKLSAGNVTCNVTVTQSNATDIEEEQEEDKKEKRTDYQLIADMYNSICTSFPSIRSLSDARKKAISARLKTYTVDDFKTVFENAEASSFLKGGNNRNWTATFDWLMKDTNMAKVLDGNYCDKSKASANKINRNDYDNGDQLPW
jgi:predicted phage replisome organizer